MESQPVLPATLEPTVGRGGFGISSRIATLIADPGIRKSALSLFDQLTISGAGFATSIIIGRFGSQQQLGAYFLALTIILIARGVQAELVTAPYTIYRQQFRGRAARTYSGSIFAHQLAIVLFSCVAFAAAAIVATATGAANGLTATLWVLSFAGPLMLFREFVRQYSFARMDVLSATLVDVFATVLQLSGLVWLWQTNRLQSPWVYAVLGIANLSAVIIWSARLQTTIRFDRQRWTPDWLRNWGFAKWALASQLVCSCTPFVMPWILAWSHGEAVAGVGAACSTLIGLSYVFTTAVANLLTPRAAAAFAQHGVKALQKVLLQTTITFVIVLGAFTVATFFLGDWLMQFVYGSTYAGYGAACFLFALSGLLNSISVVCGNGLWAIRRPQANLAADIVTLVGAFASAAVFIPAWQVTGAALAALLGTGLGAAVRAATLLLELKQARRELTQAGDRA